MILTDVKDHCACATRLTFYFALVTKTSRRRHLAISNKRPINAMQEKLVSFMLHVPNSNLRSPRDLQKLLFSSYRCRTRAQTQHGDYVYALHRGIFHDL
jgi:hypothetical protein